MEIEVKARLTDEKSILSELKKLGCSFSEPVTQIDTVYAQKTGTVDDFLSSGAYFRIRVQNGSKVMLTAKKPKAKTGHESLVKREHEVVVDSAEEALGILELMGLKEAVRLEKSRRTASYKDYEICIDEIRGLGAFIELEKIGKESEAVKTQEEMLRFLRDIGVSEEAIVKKGYDILMLEQLESVPPGGRC